MESKLQHIKYIKSLNLKNLSDKLKMYKEVLCGDKSLISMVIISNQGKKYYRKSNEEEIQHQLKNQISL